MVALRRWSAEDGIPFKQHRLRPTPARCGARRMVSRGLGRSAEDRAHATRCAGRGEDSEPEQGDRVAARHPRRGNRRRVPRRERRGAVAPTARRGEWPAQRIEGDGLQGQLWSELCRSGLTDLG